MKSKLKKMLEKSRKDTMDNVYYIDNILWRDQQGNISENDFYINNNTFDGTKDAWQINLIKQNPYNIEKIQKEASDIIIKYAIDKDVNVITVLDSKYISLDVFLHIIGKDFLNAGLIKNPTKPMIKYVARNYYDGDSAILGEPTLHYVLAKNKFVL